MIGFSCTTLYLKAEHFPFCVFQNLTFEQIFSLLNKHRILGQILF